eukprot:EG_transcript_13754
MHNEIPYDYDAAREAKGVDVHLKPVRCQEIAKTLKRGGAAAEPSAKRKRFAWQGGQEEVSDVSDAEAGDPELLAEQNKLRPPSPAPAPVPASAEAPRGAPARVRVTAHTVVASNLAPATTEEALAAAFRGCGAIVEVALWRKASGASKGKGFIEFQNADAVTEALKLNGLVVDGKPIVVEVKKTDAPLPKEVKSSSSEVPTIVPKTTVFVQGIYPNTPENVLREFFKSAGVICDCRIMAKKRCALVQFDSLEASRKALELNGQRLMGQMLKVQYDRGTDSLRRVIPEDLRTKQKEEARRAKEQQKLEQEEGAEQSATAKVQTRAPTAEADPTAPCAATITFASNPPAADSPAADPPAPPPARGTWWKPQKVLARPKPAPAPSPPPALPSPAPTAPAAGEPTASSEPTAAADSP